MPAAIDAFPSRVADGSGRPAHTIQETATDWMVSRATSTANTHGVPMPKINNRIAAVPSSR